MIIEMNQDGDGVWTYADPEQVDMVFQLEAISGLDLTSWDVMLNDDLQWEGHEKARQELAGLRQELTHAYKQHFNNNAMLEIHCQRYWLALQAARMHATGRQLEKKAVIRKAQSKDAAKQPRQKDPLRAKIIEVMGPSKKSHASFHDFLQSWMLDPIRGLSVERVTDGYFVLDENGKLDKKDKLPTAIYKRSSLSKMYSE